METVPKHIAHTTHEPIRPIYPVRRTISGITTTQKQNFWAKQCENECQVNSASEAGKLPTSHRRQVTNNYSMLTKKNVAHARRISFAPLLSNHPHNIHMKCTYCSSAAHSTSHVYIIINKFMMKNEDSYWMDFPHMLWKFHSTWNQRTLLFNIKTLPIVERASAIMITINSISRQSNFN